MGFIFASSLLDAAVLVILALAALYIYFTWRMTYWQSRGVPSPKPGLVWSRLTWARHQHALDQETYIELQKTVRGAKFGGFYEGREPILMLHDPELLRSMLVKDFDHFANRRTYDVSRTDPLFHKMMTNMEGQEWKDLRSVMTPTFTSGKMKRTFPVMRQNLDQLENYLREKATKGEPVEMYDCFGKFAMDIIASTAFGINCDSFKNQDEIFQKKVRMLSHVSAFRIVKFILAMLFPRVFSTLRISLMPSDSIDFFEEVIKSTLKHRRGADGPKINDFLQLLMDAQRGELKDEDESGPQDQYDKDAQLNHHPASREVLTDDAIVSQCILFFLAGYGTISSLLSFAVFQLALNQDIQTKLVEEIDRVILKHGGLSYDAIREMEYLDMIIMETLRMYPPAVRLERRCTKDYVIPDSRVVIEKGTLLAIPIYAIHHDERHYPNPSKFDPERFTLEEKRRRNPYIFLPFGHGPRNCIGMRFALMEAKMALVGVLRHFSVEPCYKTAIPIVFDKKNVFLSSATGIWLRVKERDPPEVEITHL